MKKTTFFVLSIAISLLLFSCSSDYKDVSQREFLEEALPNSTVHTISVKNNNAIIETATAGQGL